MKWFNWFKRSLENPAVPLNSEAAYDLLAATPSASGIPVTYKAVLGYGPVRRGVKLIADKVASLPLNVYKRASDDSRSKDTKHPAYKLLNKSPSGLYTPFNFRRQMTAYCILYGNSYAAILRDEWATPTELLILNPEATWVEVIEGRIVYKTQMNNTQYALAPEDVLHLKDLGDGVVGDSLLQIARDALGLSLSLQKHAATYFRNGASGKRVLILPEFLKDFSRRQQFREEWMKTNAGLDNSSKDMFAPFGTTIQTLSNNLEEAQFNQSRQADLVMIADLLGIPPHKLGANISSSYSSLESENKAFLSDCLDPWLVSWEQECETKLLTEYEKQTSTRYVEFDRKSGISIDANTETNLLVTQLNNGLLSWEEARQKSNLPTDKDKKQEWRRPANITIEGEEPKQPPQEEPKQPTPQPVLPQDPKDPGEDRAKALTRQIIRRLITRLHKSVEAGKTDLNAHREVFVDHLQTFTRAEQFTDQLLTNLQEELYAVLPEQRASVIERLDADKLTEELWQN